MPFATNVQRWISNFKSWDLNFRYYSERSGNFKYHSKRLGNRMIFTLKFIYTDPVSPELLEHRVKHNTFLYICRGNIHTFINQVRVTSQNSLQEDSKLWEYKFIIDFPEKLCEKL